MSARVTHWDGESALLVGEWVQMAVAAGLTAASIAVSGVPTVRRRRVPAPVTITRLGCVSNINALGGDLRAEVWINASPSGLSATMVAGTNEAVSAGQICLAPEDDVTVRITTPVGWLSLTLDVLVTLWGV